jgi:hypothetical protein
VNIGKIATPATAEDVQRFVEWYQRKNPTASLPKDVQKFVDHWRAWQTAKAPAPVEVEEQPDPDEADKRPLTVEQARAGRLAVARAIAMARGGAS